MKNRFKLLLCKLGCCHQYGIFSLNHTRSLSLIFYGSDEFSLLSLKSLVAHRDEKDLITKLEVVTKPRTLIDKFSKEISLRHHHWPYRLRSSEFDLGIVVSFGELIDKDSIQSCEHGMINVHPSLLPRWRGSTPIPRAIMAGDEETGVTIVTIKPEKFDIGDVLMKASFPLSEHIKTKELVNKLGNLGANLLIECIENLQHHLQNAQPQGKKGSCYAKKLKVEDAFVDWRLLSAIEVDRKFRALDGILPLFTKWINSESLRLYEMINFQESSSLNWSRAELLINGQIVNQPGLCMYNKRLGALCIKCSDQNWVAFKTLGLKNHRRMSALDFNNGFLSKAKNRKLVILPHFNNKNNCS
ncbi:methionyl-tRNA formyltransferase, mitochondrial [Brevipalpus obovatus]|uniref:methionyl-tRNA formyltransferase, mitochondrial n=1 Tax=Brevipalpus obovatus TaxID=246614 RepID=UPI003D9DFE4F